MKKTLILIFVLLSFGCEKTFLNYRTKFLGDYNFTIHVSTYDPISGPKDTTYFCEGKIDYGSEDNEVLISVCGGGGRELILYEDGTIDGNKCGGEFESTRKISYSCYWASPAAHRFQSVIGERK